MARWISGGARSRTTRGRTVVMLHDVLPEGRPLGDSGFTGPGPDRYKIRLPLFEAMARRARAAGTVLTFDDGGRSALDVVAPVLAEHGLRGEFFVATARLGTPGFLDRRGVGELAAAGHVVGSHSHTHPEVMPALSDEQILAEWRTSIAVLEDVTGRPVEYASVPNGFTEPRPSWRRRRRPGSGRSTPRRPPGAGGPTGRWTSSGGSPCWPWTARAGRSPSPRARSCRACSSRPGGTRWHCPSGCWGSDTRPCGPGSSGRWPGGRA